MKTKAVRLYGKKDLRLEEFELPKIADDEILAHVVSDSVCMSSYKAAVQGGDHKRVPADLADKPIIIGHEFCGELLEIGRKWRGRFAPGMRFAIQPAFNYKGSLAAPGYSYRWIGGAATHIVIPAEAMEMNCLLEYKGQAWFHGSLAEPMSCIVGAFHAAYHAEPGQYVHRMGIAEGGRMAILAGVGPMGLGAIDYALHAGRRPGLLVVTDIDDARLARAASIHSPEEAARAGIKLIYLNTKNQTDPEKRLMEFSGGEGYDDVMVFAPVKPVVELADRILGRDGCLNFFAGPTDPAFSAQFNFYNVHYAGHHLVGTSGGNTDDMIESLALMSDGRINPVPMITHVGGLDAVVETTLNLPSLAGGKKLIYTNISLPLTAIDDFAAKGETDPLFAGLALIAARHNGLWSAEAESYLLGHADEI